jgi:transporter family protein
MKLDLIALSFAVILLWGCWAFLYKLGASKIGLTQAIFCAYIVGAIVSILIAGFLIFKIPSQKFDLIGYGMVALATIFGTAGTIIWYTSLSKYEASIIVPFTALYPLVTVFLSIVVLKEQIQLANVVGILLALIACFLLSI